MTNLRPMLVGDIDQVYEIEAEAFPKPWSKESLYEELTVNKAASYWVLLVDDRIVGYFGLWIISDVAHVICLAIDKAYRGRGYGSTIIGDLVKVCEEAGVESISLEVLLTNEVAIHLYEKYGFEKTAIRMSYFRQNNESCYVMTKEMEGK